MSIFLLGIVQFGNLLKCEFSFGSCVVVYLVVLFCRCKIMYYQDKVMVFWIEGIVKWDWSLDIDVRLNLLIKYGFFQIGECVCFCFLVNGIWGRKFFDYSLGCILCSGLIGEMKMNVYFYLFCFDFFVVKIFNLCVDVVVIKNGCQLLRGYFSGIGD